MQMDPAQDCGASWKAEVLGKQEILGLSMLSELVGESRQTFLDLATLEHLPRRHVIAAQGEPPRSFLLIGAGRINLERTHGERVLPLGHRGPGQMVGEMSLGNFPTAAESARVLDDVDALAIPVATMRAHLAVDARLRVAVAAAIVRQHRALERRIEGLLLHTVETRLVLFLLDAAGRWGRLHEAGDVITAPFTHAEIALLIGSTRETVTLILGKLKRDGLLAFDRRRIVLRDRAGLSRRASVPAA
jgi:CRP-like cAMP-binding protein